MAFKLAVKVVRAYNKPFSKCRQGSAGAFVVLTFDRQQFRTSTKFNEVNPLWNESFYFDYVSAHDFVLEAFVYGVNKPVQSATSLLGKVTLRVPGTRPNDVRVMYYPLAKSGMFSHEAKGVLGLKVLFIDEASIGAQESKIASSQSAAMRFCVEIVSAHHLMPKDEQGSSSSTCVELSFDYYHYRTAVKENDLNPMWNERFYFDVWDPSTTFVLLASVYHVNKSIRGYKSFLGKVRLNLSSFLSYSDGAPTLYHPLQRSGMFSHGVTGGLRLRIYIDTTRDLHVLNKLSILRNQCLPFQFLKEITNNFHKERILCQGDFGVLYKGVRPDGEMIAVKRILSSFYPGLQKQFENEVYHLTMLKHPNIVRFLGYCYEIQIVCSTSNGKHVNAEMSERLICMEYLPEGSLDNYLSVADESRGLDWSTRCNIIQGICYGLRYLHKNTYKPIIPMDLKPANVLLDEDMVPKFMDFGLPRPVDQQQTIKTSSHDGTRGYKPPEFFHGNKVTPMSNIFSLGVIILEVITGHKPDITKEYRHGIRMETFQNWRNVVQRSLRHGSQEIDWERIKRFIRVGLICMNPDPTKRPLITTVINMLEGSERTYCDISNLPTTDCPLCSREFDVPNNLERTLQDQSSKPQDMSFQHLKEITNNFSEERIVGSGGSGVVYKGVLQNGEIIAVKKIVSSVMPGQQEKFQSEVDHLMTVKHSNIVRCVGYCYEVHTKIVEHNGENVCAEMQERLLCLEYLPKGCLLKYLSDGNADKSARLDWSTHYTIIQGICYGLRHLHEEIDKPIIHLDLKPGNILLDDHMVPKITDFGLSRHDPQQTICTSSRQGTLGYMAPEFLHGGTITPKSDIFSLGVIILEITARNRDYPDVTRECPDDFIEITLDKWRNALKRQHGSQEMDCEQIKRCIQVGLICVNPDRIKRPPITKVINMLQGLESIDTTTFAPRQLNEQAREGTEVEGTGEHGHSVPEQRTRGVLSSI